MERRQLDFFRHETYCSGKCASKNYRAVYKESQSPGDSFQSELYPFQERLSPEILDSRQISATAHIRPTGEQTELQDELKLLQAATATLPRPASANSAACTATSQATASMSFSEALIHQQEHPEDIAAADELMFNSKQSTVSAVQRFICMRLH